MCIHNNNNNKTSNMSYKKRLASSSDEFVTLFQASILFVTSAPRVMGEGSALSHHATVRRNFTSVNL